MSAPHHSDEVVWDIGWDEMDAAGTLSKPEATGPVSMPAEARLPAQPTLHPEHERLISLCAQLEEERNVFTKRAEELEAELEDSRRLQYEMAASVQEMNATMASLEEKIRLTEQERAESQEALTAQRQREEMVARQRDAAEATLRDAKCELEKLKEEIAEEHMRSQLASVHDQDRKTLVSQLTQELSKTKNAFGNLLTSSLRIGKKGEDEALIESASKVGEFQEGHQLLQPEAARRGDHESTIADLTEKLSKTKSAYHNLLASFRQNEKQRDGLNAALDASTAGTARLRATLDEIRAERDALRELAGQAPEQKPADARIHRVEPEVFLQATPTTTQGQENKSASIWSNATRFFETQRTAARSLLPEGSIFFQGEPEDTELPTTTESEEIVKATLAKRPTPVRPKQNLVGPAFIGEPPESSGQSG